MNDLIRPSLYNAFHNIIHVEEDTNEDVKTWDICGPICETSDFLGKQRRLRIREGQFLGKLLVVTSKDLLILTLNFVLAVLNAGAYCSSMASQYNSRPRPAEVMVDGCTSKVIRRRETISDLFAHELL